MSNLAPCAAAACRASTDPQADELAGRLAFCQEAPNRWTQLAWELGRRLLRGPVRRPGSDSPERRVLIDLERMRLVSRGAGGWCKITDAGRAAFPRERCTRWRYAFSMIWVNVEARRSRTCSDVLGRLVPCDSRPSCWRSVSAHLCRFCA